MKYFKVYTVNGDNKIEFTKEELEKALQKAYEDGYADGKTSILPISYGRNDWLNSAYSTAATTSISNYDVKGEH